MDQPGAENPGSAQNGPEPGRTRPFSSGASSRSFGAAMISFSRTWAEAGETFNDHSTNHPHQGRKSLAEQQERGGSMIFFVKSLSECHVHY